MNVTSPICKQCPTGYCCPATITPDNCGVTQKHLGPGATDQFLKGIGPELYEVPPNRFGILAVRCDWPPFTAQEMHSIIEDPIAAVEPYYQEELRKPAVLDHEEFQDLFHGDGSLPGLGFHSC